MELQGPGGRRLLETPLRRATRIPAASGPQLARHGADAGPRGGSDVPHAIWYYPSTGWTGDDCLMGRVAMAAAGFDR